MTDDNLYKIFIIEATIYVLYICSIQLAWCIRKFVQRFNAVLPILKETHKYRIIFCPTVWHQLEPGSDIYFSIQGEKGISKFFALPKKKIPELSSSFSFYTPGCLQELYSVIIHVQGTQAQIWKMEFIQIIDIPHATKFTFPFYCDLQLSPTPTLYMSTAQKKFYPRSILFGKRTLINYHNYISPFSNCVTSSIWPIIPLTFILSEVLNGLLFGVITIFFEQIELGNALLMIILFAYLMVKIFLPDIVYQFSERRGRGNRVWKRRRLVSHIPEHFSTDTDDDIPERKVTVERQILRALNHHPLVAAVREEQKSITQSPENSPGIQSASQEDLDDIVSHRSSVSSTESTSPSPTYFSAQSIENPTLFKVLFYPFNIKQLFENRVHLWTLFFELWHTLQVKMVEAYRLLLPAVGMLQKLHSFMDVNLFQQELNKLLPIITEFELSLRMSNLRKLTDEDEPSEMLISIPDVESEHKKLIQLLDAEILKITYFALDDISLHKEGMFFFQSRRLIEESLQGLIENLFNTEYLIKIPHESLSKLHAYLPLPVKDTSDLKSPYSDSELSVQTLALIDDVFSLTNNFGRVSIIDRQDFIQIWYQWIPSFVTCFLDEISKLHEEKFLHLGSHDAIILIQVQESTRTWEDACRLYVKAIMQIVKDALIKYLCFSLSKDIRLVLSVILQRTFLIHLSSAVEYALSSSRNIPLPSDHLTEALSVILKKILNSNVSESSEGLNVRLFYFKQIKLMFLLNGLLRTNDIRIPSNLTSRMNAILHPYPEKIKHLKSSVPMLLEEFHSVRITNSSSTTVNGIDDIMFFTMNAGIALRQVEKALIAAELCLDAIHLDIPFAALDFNADEINLLRVQEVLQSYFGDRRQLSLTSTGTRTLSSRCTLPFPSVVTLETFMEISPNTLMLLRKPWIPNLPFYCGWIMMIIVGCDIIFTSVAIAVHGRTFSNSDLHSALLFMLMGIVMDVFMLQPIKCAVIVFLNNCLYRRGVFEMYEIDQNLIQ